MIIFGSNSRIIAKKQLDINCPHCGTKDSIAMNIVQKYAHVFWIPFFPVGKRGVSQCMHCRQILESDRMPDVMRNYYDNMVVHSKAPVWMYSGIFLIAGLITLGVVSSRMKDKRNARLIQTPRRGDIYEIKLNDGSYTLYRVEETSRDSVYIQPSRYETNKETGLSDIKRKGGDGYDEIIISFSKQELIQMQKDGRIIDIDN